MVSYNKMDDELRMHDIHFWVKKPDGTIFDPYFSVYDDFKRQNNLTGENVYEEETDKEFIKRCEKYHLKNTLMPTFKRLKKQGINLYDNFVKNPKPYFCMLTAVAYTSKYKGEIVCGKLGWKNKNNDKIKWMFGDK